MDAATSFSIWSTPAHADGLPAVPGTACGAAADALPEWTVRLLVPRHLTSAHRAVSAGFREQVGTPLRRPVIEELTWFFQTRRAERAVIRHAVRAGDARVRESAVSRAVSRVAGARRRGPRRHDLARPCRTPWPGERAGWSAMSYRMGICISPPWLARRERRLAAR